MIRNFRKLTLALLLLPAIGAWAGTGKEKTDIPSSGDTTFALADAKERIKTLKARQGTELYVGEGMADIKDDIGDARQSARTRALAELSSAIKVKVKGQIKDDLRISGKNSEAQFQSIVDTYVDTLLTGVKDESFLDYPKKNVITVLVFVSKHDYDEAVVADMRLKLDRIQKYAREGLKARGEKRVAEALKDFADGRHWLVQLFGELPVQGDIAGDGKQEDLGAFFETQVTRLTQALKLEVLDQKIIYDAKGVPNRQPLVYVKYDDGAQKFPVPNMPLTVSFAEGNGKLSPAPLKTGTLGEAQIPVTAVDASAQKVSLLVSIDPKALGQQHTETVPNIVVALERMRTLAYCVTAAGAQAVPPSFGEAIRSLLTDSGFASLQSSLSAPVNEETIRSAGLNADYLLSVRITLSGGKDEYDMYYADAGAQATVYSLPVGTASASVEGKPAHGYGVNKTAAANDALAKLKHGLLPLLKARLKDLK